MGRRQKLIAISKTAAYGSDTFQRTRLKGVSHESDWPLWLRVVRQLRVR
jgi:hypothetical protein